ncbi:MAG TPA: ferritin-like domain-containing protein [Polyangiaceae bacterium]|nr:ferritin-like domain-containing protein [Polyangiaceae bacterium]
MRSALLVSILGALTACEGTHDGLACLNVPAEQTTCPAAQSLKPQDLYSTESCGSEVVALKGEGKRRQVGDVPTEACCYPAEVTDTDNGCSVGRPYFEGGVQRQAPLRSSSEDCGASNPRRAAAWALAGSGEHASVAAFARLSLQLMALGAPNALLRDVHQAALEEVDHAERCWEFARLFGGAEITPGPFPFQTAPSTCIGLAELAAAAVREGCLAETLGAHVLGVAAERAPEPAVRAALLRMAEEEARHAVLSFRIVAWALRSGDAEVRASIHAAFAAPWPSVDVRELSLRSNVDVQCLAAAAEQGVNEVLTPAAARLLAA